MPEVKLIAELRTEFGKGAARRIRRADKVPAVLYGHGTDPDPHRPARSRDPARAAYRQRTAVDRGRRHFPARIAQAGPA